MPCQTRGSVAEATEGADGRPVSGEDAWRSGAGRRDLLLAKHRVLHALGEPELAHALGRDLDRLARLRIAAHPRLAVRQHQFPEARKDETVLCFLAGQRQSLVEDLDDLSLREVGLASEVRHDCGLAHHLRHRKSSSMEWNVERISITGGRTRLPVAETELTRRDQTAVRAEARLRVLDRVERRVDRLTIRVSLHDAIERVALRGRGAGLADEPHA